MATIVSARQHERSAGSRQEAVQKSAISQRTSPMMHVQKLCVNYENSRTGELTEAVSNVYIDIFPGEFVTIVGLSGCGKSTFLSAVAGLVPYQSGILEVAGKTVNGPGPDRAVVFQRASLLPWRTVLENVIY